jgi:hypothetical protein
METCRNRKRKVPIVPIATIKSIKPIARPKTQHVKLGKIHVHYPYIICYSIEHRSIKCPKKIEVQNMFRTKHVSSNATTTPKPPKINNV